MTVYKFCRHCKKEIRLRSKSRNFNILKYEDKILGSYSNYIHFHNNSPKCRPDNNRSKIAFPQDYKNFNVCPECGSRVKKQGDIHACVNVRCSFWWAPVTLEIDEKLNNVKGANIYDQELGQAFVFKKKEERKKLSGSNKIGRSLIHRRPKRKIRVKREDDD